MSPNNHCVGVQPYEIYTAEDLARILKVSKRTLQRRELPLPMKKLRPRRWLGLTIINFLRERADLPAIDDVIVESAGGSSCLATEKVADVARDLSVEQTKIRLPRVARGQRVGRVGVKGGSAR